jgi:hypothetical protein
MNSRDKIIQETTRVENLLLRKNASYGDSALKPANVFAKGSAVENLCSRIDDKLMRIKNKGINVNTTDTIDDLIGYLILLNIALKDAEPTNSTETGNDVQERDNSDGTVPSDSRESYWANPVPPAKYTWPDIED